MDKLEMRFVSAAGTLRNHPDPDAPPVPIRQARIIRQQAIRWAILSILCLTIRNWVTGGRVDA